MAIHTLKASDLQHLSSPDRFAADTLKNIEYPKTIIGQPRAVRAIEFGLNINSPGYNIFVMGETGPGQISTIEHFLKKHAETRPVPNEWVYVHNFRVTHQARAISLPAGDGGKLKEDMDDLVTNLKRDLPEAFETEAYRDEAESLRQLYNEERDSLVEELREQAGVDQITVVHTATGFLLMPLIEGKAMSTEEYNSLPIEDHRQWEKKRQGWDDELEKLLHKLRELDQTYQDQMNELNQSVAGSAIKHYFERLKEKYDSHNAVLTFLDEAYENVLDSLNDFFLVDQDDRDVDFRRYSVNLLVDYSQNGGAPVIVEHNPRYHTLFGRIEYESQHTTHFTNIKAGALHKANGGYLVLNVNDILKHSNAWDALKRALKTNEILLQHNFDV